MKFFTELLYPLASREKVYEESQKERYKMRKLFTCPPYSYGLVFDYFARKILDDAGVDMAEDFIQILKASPLYQKRVCETTKKKLEEKRAEVAELEKQFNGSCI